MMIQLRIALILVGLVLFLFSQRFGLDWMRWAGIAMVVLALLLRFWKPTHKSR